MTTRELLAHLRAAGCICTLSDMSWGGHQADDFYNLVRHVEGRHLPLTTTISGMPDVELDEEIVRLTFRRLGLPLP